MKASKAKSDGKPGGRCLPLQILDPAQFNRIEDERRFAREEFGGCNFGVVRNRLAADAIRARRCEVTGITYQLTCAWCGKKEWTYRSGPAYGSNKRLKKHCSQSCGAKARAAARKGKKDQR